MSNNRESNQQRKFQYRRHLNCKNMLCPLRGSGRGATYYNAFLFNNFFDKGPKDIRGWWDQVERMGTGTTKIYSQ